MISARGASVIGDLRLHGRLRLVCQASLSGYGPGYSGWSHRPTSENTDPHDCAATGQRRSAAVPGHRFEGHDGHDHHVTGCPVGLPASAAARPGGMAGPARGLKVKITGLVCRSLSCFDGTGLSLGGLSMRSRMPPMFESCLPPNDASSCGASPCIAGWDLRPTQQRLAWCGS